MPNDIYRKRNNKYRNRQAKKYLRDQQKLKSLEKEGFPASNSDSPQSKIAARQISRLLLFMIFISLFRTANGQVCQNGNDKNCIGNNHKKQTPEAKSIKIETHGDVKKENCEAAREAISNLQDQQVSSTARIQRVTRQKDFKFVCAPKEILSQAGSHAFFYPQENVIYFSESNPEPFFFSHELIHAEKFALHSTKYCNEAQLTKKQINEIKKIDPLDISTAAPLWPPTKENINMFTKITQADDNLKKVEELILMCRKKYFKQQFTSIENEKFNKYSALLHNTVPIKKSMLLSEKETQEISSYQKKHNGKLPITFICQNGIIYKNIFMNKHPENSFYHLEGYIEDPISVFLFNHDRSLTIYDAKMKENDSVSAASELDAYRRTGVSDEVIQEFYPNQWLHTQKELDCCENGNKKSCYQAA